MAVGFATQFILGVPVPGQGGRTAKTSPGPRAIGLLVLQPNGKARLIPITILINGQYFDASAYKAAPVPMALWSDTVYEAMRAGVSQGLFTVTGALQQKGARDATEWMGEGTWQTTEMLKAKTVKKPEAAEPRGMNEDEGPPVLRRSGAEKPKPPEIPAVPAAPAQHSGASSTSTAEKPQQAPPAGTASPAPAPPSAPPIAEEGKSPEDRDRPILMRGKSGAQQAEKAQNAKGPAANAGGTAANAKASAAPRAQATDQIQLIPAISDSHGPDPVPYSYSMKPEEEAQFRKKMLAMAADEVRSHTTQPTKGAMASATAAPPRSKSTTKVVPPIFEDVQLRVLDLQGINEPELVLTANAHVSQSSRQRENTGSEPSYAVTLVARQDVNGDFHKALASVTDAQHLDVFPRLEFIDAVDADGDGRGELLFRQVYDAGTAFVVYRVIGDRLYPLFQGTP